MNSGDIIVYILLALFVIGGIFLIISSKTKNGNENNNDDNNDNNDNNDNK